ncbi:hypothetical protein ZWY2020_036845 [Hordeum vulgare]|nr:hypothetical protein ZWY2020_036845 [Hordeum vulgare]
MRSEEALQQFSRFNHLGGISRSTTAASTRYGACFRSRRPTPNGEPIGIDSPMKKLEAWLGKDGEQKLKMVSVVGSGGIGKTTLVKQLYRRISGQFECRAYVRTSRKPDVRRLLISMLSQIRPHQSPRDWKVYSLIADIRTHLQDKRYLIVIDDVWATQTWDVLCRALPDDEMFSVEEEEYTTLQKQYEIMEGDSIEQHEVLRKGSEEDAHSRACPPCRMGEGSESSSEAQQYNIMENDSNKKHEIQEYSNQYAPGRLPKKRRMVVWNKQVRVRSAQDDLVGDDGFSWRKYRQKLIPGCKYPRVFYQCAHKKKKG